MDAHQARRDSHEHATGNVGGGEGGDEMELIELSLDGFDSRGSFSEIGTEGSGARGDGGIEKQDLLSSAGGAGDGYSGLNDGEGVGAPAAGCGPCDRFLSSVLPGPRCVRNILGTELWVTHPNSCALKTVPDFRSIVLSSVHSQRLTSPPQTGASASAITVSALCS